MRRRSVLAAAAAAILLVAATVVGADDGWQRVLASPRLELPRDHGAHPEFRTEWWYATGTLEDADGRPLGFQLTFFRQGLEADPPPDASPLRASQVLAAHLAVADPGAGRVVHAERLRRLDGLLAGTSVDGLDVFLGGWTMTHRTDGTIVLAADDPASGIGLALELAPAKPPVAHGRAGLSQKGPAPGNASVYVSWTRLEVRGTLTVDGGARQVTGGAWIDHEWGTSQLGAGIEGWDWWGLRLDDGRELMLYRLRPAGGGAAPFSAGTLVARDGTTMPLAWDTVRLDELAYWTSPRTGAVYPAAWRLRIPAAGLDLRVRPLVADAELDTRASTGVVYWEGPVVVEGTVGGAGYAELTGYAGDVGF